MQTATATKTSAAPKKIPTALNIAPRKTTSNKPATAALPLQTISEVKLVPLELIDISEQIRKDFDDENIKELACDILEKGLLQPVLLNPINDRYQMIAGERRLRAVRLNGATCIPALPVKASSKDALLIQLSENVHRQELTLQEECDAVITLYNLLGNLDEVAKAVKKSKPWCSKRYASAHREMHYAAKALLESGECEDIELLNALSSLAKLIGWTASSEWANKVREGKADRNMIRAALKKAKEKAKEEKAAETKPADNVSHAKQRTPPPPPAWTIDNAMDDLSQALNYIYNEVSGTELLATWTAEQQQEVEERIKKSAAAGIGADGFKTISHLIMNGIHGTPYIDIDLMAMIKGYRGDPIEWPGFLEELQCPREKK